MRPYQSHTSNSTAQEHVDSLENEKHLEYSLLEWEQESDLEWKGVAQDEEK